MASVVDAAIAPPPSRNSPCPCGSGLRYKDCHGSLAPARSAAPRSTYRAPGTEWAHLEPAARDACGVLMERALQHQTAGRLDDAAREYGEVVAQAPSTHDALHMLGVIELARQNLDEAERLIRAALALRPPYAAIEHNLLLVQDARVARMRAQPEELAERALPILADLALAAGEPRSPNAPAPAPIHLVGRVGGDDDDAWLLQRLAEMLGVQCACVWTPDDDAPTSIAGVRVARIDPAFGRLPRGGTHVYVGLDVDVDDWIARAAADRVIAIPVGALPTACLDRLRALAHDGARRVEIALPSAALAGHFGQGHAVVVPPIAPTAPPAAAREAAVYGEWRIEEARPWPVGVRGQNRRFVAETADIPFVRALADVAGSLHVHDPGRMRYAFGADPRVRFFVRDNDSLVPFLSTLRCYVHRVDRWWEEGLARELLTAMALGVPVLCPSTSQYAEYVSDGVDGVLYGSADDALAKLAELRRAPAFAASIGQAARAKAARLLDPAAVAAAWGDLVVGVRRSAQASRVAEGARIAT